MTLKEAINELKAMKPHIESNMSVAGYDAYDMAIRGLELWDIYAEEVDDVYEDGKGETYLIREWIEDEGGTAETVKPTAETSQNVPDDDLIWRKAALQIFFDFAGCIPDTPIGEYQTAYKAYRHKMENLPPVQPKEII